ncbi:MAG: response regulator [Pseudomonadota bacterium]
MTRRVLIVDDDREVREALGQTLELADLDPILAGSFVVAKDHISADFDGVILSDIRMPGRDGFHVLSYCRDQDADLPVVLLTGEGDIPMAVEAIGRGAFDFLEKPCASADLIPVLERALHTRSLVLENRALKAQISQGDPAARLIVGISDAAENLRERIRKVSALGSDALITGPVGSHIPKVADVLHQCSQRSKLPFVKRASRGLTPMQLSQALEEAENGSVFLDEVACLPAATQLELGAVLDTSNRACLYFGASGDLSETVETGAFDADLFYRMSGVILQIRPLAERREDIPVLFRRSVAQAAEQAGLEPPEITEDLLSRLMSQEWPGNTRAVMAEAMRFATGMQDAGALGDPQSLGLVEQMARVEKSLLEQALRRAGGRARAAADSLRLPRKTFYDKLARHDIRPERFRDP